MESDRRNMALLHNSGRERERTKGEKNGGVIPTTP